MLLNGERKLEYCLHKIVLAETMPIIVQEVIGHHLPLDIKLVKLEVYLQ